MKAVATGLLVLAAIVFVIARLYEDDVRWLRYVRATSEAAMVGAIADWFAITALFKRPLGLPIPHTALIPERKDDIGAGLSSFVQSNFLSRRVISEKLESVDMSRRIGEWLREPENAHSVAGELALAASTTTELLGDDLQRTLDTAVRDRLGETSVVSLTKPIIDTVILFLREVGDESGGHLSDHLKSDEFAAQLRSHPQLAVHGEQLKHQLLDHPEFHAWMQDLWSSLQHGLGDAAKESGSVVRRRIEVAIVALAEHLLRDVELQRKVDAWIESLVVTLAEAGASEIGNLIEDTVKGWDADELIARIEPPIGCDLQFVRINGTLVGGLAGLVIFIASELWF